jgi:hypothetical protein
MSGSFLGEGVSTIPDRGRGRPLYHKNFPEFFESAGAHIRLFRLLNGISLRRGIIGRVAALSASVSLAVKHDDGCTGDYTQTKITEKKTWMGDTSCRDRSVEVPEIAMHPASKQASKTSKVKSQQSILTEKRTVKYGTHHLV